MFRFFSNIPMQSLAIRGRLQIDKSNSKFWKNEKRNFRWQALSMFQFLNNYKRCKYLIGKWSSFLSIAILVDILLQSGTKKLLVWRVTFSTP